MIWQKVLIPWKISESVEAIRELDNSENIQIGCDKDFLKKISELKKYCLGRGFIYVDKDNINEYSLNDSKLYLNEKGASLFSKNISAFLDVTWNASTDAKDIDNTNHNMKKGHVVDRVLSDLWSTNPSNLNFCFLNINSVRNKFTDEVRNENVNVVSIADAQFLFEGYHWLYRLDISSKNGVIPVYVKSSIPSHRLYCKNLFNSIQAVPFEINLRK